MELTPIFFEIKLKRFNKNRFYKQKGSIFMRKWKRAVAIGLTAMLVLGGCGSTGTDQTIGMAEENSTAVAGGETADSTIVHFISKLF